MQCRSDEIKQCLKKKRQRQYGIAPSVTVVFLCFRGLILFLYSAQAVVGRIAILVILVVPDWASLDQLKSFAPQVSPQYQQVQESPAPIHEFIHRNSRDKLTREHGWLFWVYFGCAAVQLKIQTGCKLRFPVLQMTFYSCLGQLTALQVLNVVGFLWTSDPEIDRSCTQKRQRMAHGM